MIVMDASAAVDIVRQNDIGQALLGLYSDREEVISCSLMRAEVASAFRKFARTKSLPLEMAVKYLAQAVALVDTFVPIEDLQAEALAESIRLDHSTYDMFYFVLARRTGATLFTTDKPLMELCADNNVECVWETQL